MPDTYSQANFAVNDATGQTTAQTWKKRLNAICFNVKDFGAVGDNSHDDTGAIQACFDAAFGTSASPHGNGGGTSNTPVYFPPGTYKVTSPIRATAVWGGKIFGAGKQSSILSFQGTITPIDGDNICPTLYLNGCNYTTISDMSFTGTSDPTNHYTACIWFGPDGANGGSSAHSNLIYSVRTSTTSKGIVHGSTNSQANSENAYISCNFDSHEQYGFYASGSNTLNLRLLGCSISFCGVAGIKANNNAGIPIIQDISFDHNYVDMDLTAASTRPVISGCRTESAAFLKVADKCCIQNCQSQAPNVVAVGSTNGTTLTITSITSGGDNIQKGMVVSGSDGTNSLPTTYPNTTRITGYGTGTGGTGTYTLSQSGTPGNIGAGTTFTCTPVFMECAGGTIATLDMCGGPYDIAIIGVSNAALYIRGNIFYDSNASAIAATLFTYYLGQIRTYDVDMLSSPTAVASLPSAAAKFKGVRMIVTDSNVAGSGNFGATVAGGGSNVVPVYCDGSNWKIG